MVSIINRSFIDVMLNLQLASLLQIIAYACMVPALPFPAFCVAYALNGIGIAIQVSPISQRRYRHT